MSWDLTLRHCAAIRATLEQSRVSLDLLSAQLAGLEAYAKAQAEREARPTASVSQHEHCAIHGDACALLSEDARIEHGSLASPNGFICKGCRFISTNGVSLATT